MIEKLINKVFHSDAGLLLRALPSGSIDAVIADAMFGTSKNFQYDWGVDPGRGDPVKHWRYHQPIYRECLRVLRPGGVLAWGQGAKFYPHFRRWFDDHRVWLLGRSMDTARPPIGNVWVVQTREQRPIEFPHRDSLVVCDRNVYRPSRASHPCPKPVEELAFMLAALTKPGEIVLDCFCGVGSTLVAADAMNRKWIGCDRSKRYCQTAMKGIEDNRINRGCLNRLPRLGLAGSSQAELHDHDDITDEGHEREVDARPCLSVDGPLRVGRNGDSSRSPSHGPPQAATATVCDRHR